MQRFKTVSLLMCLMAMLSQAYAQPSVGDEYIEDIRSTDIGPVQKALKEIVGKEVEVTADWKSFQNCSLNAAQELGADIQMLPGTFTKLVEDKDAGAIVKKDVKKFIFKNNDKLKKPEVSYAKGTITLSGHFLVMNWGAVDKGLSELIKEKILKK